MELKYIKELMTAMSRSNTKRLQIKQEGVELLLERHDQPNGYVFDRGSEFLDDQQKGLLATHRIDQALTRNSEIPVRSSSPLVEPAMKEVSGLFITSPMVGTFYSSPSPEDAPFIKVGDKIEKNQVVCIIEAMKVMNEIKGQVSGTVSEVLVESGQPVEFGTKLYRIVETK